MSVETEIVVRRAVLPTVSELAAKIATFGDPVQLPSDFDWDKSGYFHGTVAGQPASFGFSGGPLDILVAEKELPSSLMRYGDQVFSFDVRGLESGLLVDQITRALVEMSNAREIDEAGTVQRLRGESEWSTLAGIGEAQRRLDDMGQTPEWKAAVAEQAARMTDLNPPKGWWASGGKYSILGWSIGAAIVGYLLLVR